MLGAFASQVDAWILAEGVERVEELDALVSLGVPLVQGYCLARPAPPWAAIDMDLAHRLAAKPPYATERDPGHPGTCDSRDSTAAAGHFAENPALQSVVLIGDHFGRFGAGRRTPRGSGWSPGMRVNLDTPLGDALARSMTRARHKPV